MTRVWTWLLLPVFCATTVGKKVVLCSVLLGMHFLALGPFLHPCVWTTGETFFAVDEKPSQAY